MEKVRFPKYARTQINWKISNFDSEILNRANFPTLESTPFNIVLKNHEYGQATTKWKLCAYRNRGTLSLYLKTNDPFGVNACYKDYQNLIINYELKLKENYSYSDKSYCNKSHGEIKNMYYEHRLGKVTSVKDLAKRTSYRIIRDKTIEIVLVLNIIENKVEGGKAKLNTSELCTQYEALYNNEKYSDFTLIAANDDEIPVHKNILSTRSPVFDRMMETKLKEGEEKKAKIDDIDSRALKEFIRFLYCGRVDDIDDIATDLLYAAEKYDLKDLKPFCVESLTKKISTKNAIDTFMLASLHEENDLKMYSLDFILWNYTELKEHESWSKVSPELLKEILDCSALKDKSGAYINLNSTISIIRPANQTPAPANPVQNAAAAAPPPAAAIQVNRINVNALRNAVHAIQGAVGLPVAAPAAVPLVNRRN